MSEIRLLPAPVDPPANQQTQSLSLIRLNPREVVARSGSPISSSCQDDYVWTASAGDDGTFTFYAAPRNAGSQSGGASQWDGEFKGSDWQKLAMQQAAAQYAMTSALPSVTSYAAATGKLIDVYA